MRTSSSSSSGSERRGSRHGDRGFWPAIVVLALAFVPWTVVRFPGGVSLIFPWGSASTNPLHVTLLSDFLFRYTGGPASLPPRLFAWPVATVMFVVAMLGAVADRLGPGDRRVTAGALVLAGLVHLRVTIGLATIGETPIPIGALLAFVVAWWYYTKSPHSGR